MMRWSSFGPCGKCKLIYDQTGSMTVTKDSHLFVELECPTSSSRGDHLREMFVSRSKLRGDGLTANLMLYDTSMFHIDQEMHTESDGIIKRLALQSIVDANTLRQNYIHEYFILNNIWNEEFNVSKWIVSTLSSVLIPSIKFSTAVIVKRVITSWLLFTISQEITFDIIINRATAYIRKLSNYLFLNNFSIPKTLLNYQILTDEFLIEGRCKESLPFQVQFNFICIQLLLSSFNPSQDSVIDQDAVLSIHSYEQLQHSQQIGTHHLIDIIDGLLCHSIQLVLCCDVIEGEALSMLSVRNIYVMDRIPLEYLEMLASKLQQPLHYNGPSWLSGDNIHQSTAACSVHRAYLCKHNESKSWFKLKLFFHQSPPSVIGTECSNLELNQLIIEVGGLQDYEQKQLFHMVKRCLMVISNVRERSSITTKSVTILPGGGAAHLGWAILWERVGHILQSEIDHTANNTSSSENPSSDKLVVRNFFDVIHPIAVDIVHQIKKSVESDYQPRTVRQFRILTQCVQLCGVISKSYFMVCKKLLEVSDEHMVLEDIGMSSIDETSPEVTVSPSIRSILYKLAHRKQSLRTISQSDAMQLKISDFVKIDCLLNNSKNFGRLWLIWNILFCYGGYDMKSVEKVGRCGLCCDVNSDQDKFFKISNCSFDDSFQNENINQYNIFWEGFTDTISSLLQYLRMGGKFLNIIQIKSDKRRNLPSDKDEN